MAVVDNDGVVVVVCLVVLEMYACHSGGRDRKTKKILWGLPNGGKDLTSSLHRGGREPIELGGRDAPGNLAIGALSSRGGPRHPHLVRAAGPRKPAVPVFVRVVMRLLGWLLRWLLIGLTSGGRLLGRVLELLWRRLLRWLLGASHRAVGCKGGCEGCCEGCR